MCILLLSTTHPAYPLILLSNRDEFLSRPTSPAAFWSTPHTHVLGGRDLERPEHGTWLGITRQGRIAGLTNFREPGAEKKAMSKSRGGIINAYLTAPQEGREGRKEFSRRLIHDVGVNDVGGFSMVFGELRGGRKRDGGGEGDGVFPGLAILSNRSASAEDLTVIATRVGETHGLSNSHFGDRSWPKVVKGEDLLRRVIQEDVEVCERGEEDQGEFVERLFEVLSVNDLPERKEGEDWDTYVLQMRNSILIPPVRGPEVEAYQASEVATAVNGTAESNGAHIGPGSYGTQKQTVILVDQEGKVVFVERTLYDQEGNPQGRGKGDKKFEFEIDGWWS